MRKQLVLVSLALLFLFVGSAQAQDFLDLSYGQPVTGEITPLADRVNYTFNGSAGDLIYITMVSPDNDLVPEFTLFDSAQNEVQVSDSTGPVAALGPIELPATDSFIVSASRASWSDSTGAYSIMVDRATVTFYQPNTEVNSSLANPNSLAFLVMDGQAGDLYRLSVLGRSMAFIFAGSEAEDGVYEGIYDDPFVPMYQLPITGEYFAVVQSMSEDGTDFTLEFNQIVPQPLPATETLSGTLDSDNPPVFMFESGAGKAWEINATLPEDGDDYMAIYYLENRPYWETIVAQDFGSGPNGSPRIAPFVAPTDGTYYIMLEFNSYNPEELTAPYDINLQSSSIVTLAPDIETTGTITPDTGSTVYSFNGKTGQGLNVTFKRLSETGVLSLYILSPEDEVITFTGRSAVSSSFDIILPVDGVYRFTVYDSDYNPTELEYSLLVTVTQP